MHSELYEVTATAAGFTLGVWALSCSLFLYWSRGSTGETGKRKQCPSKTKRIVQEENDESGRSQPKRCLSSVDDLLSRKKRRFRRRERKQMNASGECFFFYFYDICACLLTFKLNCNLKTQKDFGYIPLRNHNRAQCFFAIYTQSIPQFYAK